MKKVCLLILVLLIVSCSNKRRDSVEKINVKLHGVYCFVTKNKSQLCIEFTDGIYHEIINGKKSVESKYYYIQDTFDFKKYSYLKFVSLNLITISYDEFCIGLRDNLKYRALILESEELGELGNEFIEEFKSIFREDYESKGSYLNYYGSPYNKGSYLEYVSIDTIRLGGKSLVKIN
jgi:hypothetical protein